MRSLTGKHYSTTKLRFIRLFSLIGLVGATVMSVMFFLSGEIHPAICGLVLAVIPVFGITLFFCGTGNLLWASRFVYLVVFMGCLLAPLFQLTVFFAFFAIFVFSFGLLAINRVQYWTYVLLLGLTALFKYATEFGLLSLKDFPPTGLGLTNLVLTAIFVFAIFTYAIYITFLVEKGLRSTDELIQTKETLEVKSREAEDASAAKSIFLARVNHELRTPLQAALTASELLERSPGNLPVLRASLSQALAIVEGVLDFSRIASRDSNLDLKKFGLVSGVYEMAAVYQSRAGKKTRVLVDFAPNIPNHFIGDATRFFDIFRNLLANAVKWTEAGDVQVRFFWADDNFTKLACEVRDNGPGVPPEIADSVFQPFVQGSVRHTREPGLGLGLNIAYQAVRAMGGEIQFRNLPEGGAQFTFEVRLRPCEKWTQTDPPGLNCEKCPDKTKTTSDQAGNREKLNTNLRLLIIDDVELNCALLKKILNHHGFQQTDVAHTGREAIEKIKAGRPDIVFLDLNLPDISGFEIVKILREQAIEPQYIVLTGDATTDVFDECRRMGLSHILPKPAKFQQIRETLLRVQLVQMPK